MTKEASSEVIRFLNDNSIADHEYNEKDVHRLNLRSSFTFSSCEDSNCHTRCTHFVVGVPDTNNKVFTIHDESTQSQEGVTPNEKVLANNLDGIMITETSGPDELSGDSEVVKVKGTEVNVNGEVEKIEPEKQQTVNTGKRKSSGPTFATVARIYPPDQYI